MFLWAPAAACCISAFGLDMGVCIRCRHAWANALDRVLFRATMCPCAYRLVCPHVLVCHSVCVCARLHGARQFVKRNYSVCSSASGATSTRNMSTRALQPQCESGDSVPMCPVVLLWVNPHHCMPGGQPSGVGATSCSCRVPLLVIAVSILTHATLAVMSGMSVTSTLLC